MEKRKVIPNAPGPTSFALLGSLGDVKHNPLAFFQRSIAEYGDIVCFRFGPIRSFLLNHPDAAYRVLVEKSTDYVKNRSARAIGRIIGKGLLSNGGDLWRKHRRLMQPSFHRESLRDLVATMASATQSMLAHWSTKQRDDAFDVHDEMMRLTLRIVGQTLFSADIDDRKSEIARAFAEGNAHADHYSKSLVQLPTWIPTPRNFAIRRTVRTLDGLALRIIEEHRTADRSDLLSMLMAARDEESGERLSDRELHDEVLTMIAAGHETTASALSWCVYLLSTHPDVERALHAEVTGVLGDRPPELTDLPKLTYTACVIQEVMRLYPPVWLIERKATIEDSLLGYRIPAGASVLTFTYGLHRHERYWEKPEDFKPERFSPEQSEGRHRSIYLPFGAGPRMCIGNNFAMMEVQIILAMIEQRFRLAAVPNHIVEMKPLITLRPKHGVQVKVEARKTAPSSIDTVTHGQDR